MTDVVVFAIVYFFLGTLVGFGSFALYGLVLLKRDRKKTEEAKQAKAKLDEALKLKAAELNSKKVAIQQRLLEANELAKQQIDIRAKIEAPNMNGLHSQYKSQLITLMHTLEVEKVKILRTITDDGYNPNVTTIGPDGKESKVPLSTYISAAQANIDEFEGNSGTGKTPEPKVGAPRKVGKFTVHKGGKGDGSTTH